MSSVYLFIRSSALTDRPTLDLRQLDAPDIIFAVAGLLLRRGGRVYRNRAFLQGLRLMALSPFGAVTAGWFVTEVGRAPWLVYGVMTQAEAVTPSLTGWMALTTLIGYILVYAVVFIAGVYYLGRVIRQGMVAGDVDDVTRAMRPCRPRGCRLTTAITRLPTPSPGAETMMGNIGLSLIWAAIIAFGVIMYVLMGGFDLGVGLLFPFAPDEEARDVMMNSVAPIWDGNETWLVLGGAGLIGAFPLVYTVLLPALYLGVFLMLAGLIFRGIAFEFRFKARSSKKWWNVAFAGGSAVATFAHLLGVPRQGASRRGLSLSGVTLNIQPADAATSGARGETTC